MPNNPISLRVHPTYARLLCMLLRSEGLDVDAALEAAGLSWQGLAVESAMLEFARLQPLLEAAQRLHPDVDQRLALGLDLGQRTLLSAHGALGYAVVSSRDLRQALETVVRFASLRNDLLRFELQSHAGGVTLKCVERSDLGPARPLVLGMVLGTLLGLMSSVVGQALPGLAVTLPWAKPGPVVMAALARCGLDGTVVWDAASLCVALGDPLLDLPCLTADARAHEVAVQDCERELRQSSGAAGPWTQRVQALLRARQAPAPFPGVAEAAAHCHVSVRTLIRHLRAEGSSFQQLLDGLRQEQILEALRQGPFSNEALAYQLGFQDASNFGRAVRRWFGITPSALRERLRA